MPLTAASVSAAVTEVQEIGSEILTTVGTLDPAVEVATETAAGVVSLLGQLVSKAIAAWSAASGTPITPESVLALLPNPAPLTPPDAS